MLLNLAILRFFVLPGKYLRIRGPINFVASNQRIV
jgi:hypothetical protein